MKAHILFVEKSRNNNEGKITTDFRKSTFLIASYQYSMILLADCGCLLKREKLKVSCLISLTLTLTQVNSLWRERKNFMEIRRGSLQSQKEKS